MVTQTPSATDSSLLYANCKLLFHSSSKGFGGHGKEDLLHVYIGLADHRSIKFYGCKES